MFWQGSPSCAMAVRCDLFAPDPHDGCVPHAGSNRLVFPGMRDLLDSHDAAASRPVVAVAFSSIESFKEIMATNIEVSSAACLGRCCLETGRPWFQNMLLGTA